MTLAEFKRLCEFQSTPLMRGETIRKKELPADAPFQSTPLMRGETREGLTMSLSASNFNPLPSCEGRRQAAQRPQ